MKRHYRVTTCDFCGVQLEPEDFANRETGVCKDHAHMRTKQSVIKKKTVGNGIDPAAKFVYTHSNHIPEEPNHCGRG